VYLRLVGKAKKSGVISKAKKIRLDASKNIATKKKEVDIRST
jgi:hypothetical protein